MRGRCPEPSLRESVLILAIMLGLLALYLGGRHPTHDPISPDLQFAEAFR